MYHRRGPSAEATGSCMVQPGRNAQLYDGVRFFGRGTLFGPGHPCTSNLKTTERNNSHVRLPQAFEFVQFWGVFATLDEDISPALVVLKYSS